MANNWEYFDHTTWTGNATDSGWWSGATTSTANSVQYADSSSSTSTLFWVTVPVVKRVLIPRPSGWTKDDEIAFSVLVNRETNSTGWKVTMVIDGHVTITDPDVEVRVMRDFLPLLRRRASKADLAKIDAFFAARPLDAPGSEPTDG